MSTNKHGVLQLRCTVDVLRLALERFMPQWKGHIIKPAEGQKLVTYDYRGRRNAIDEDKNIALLIPGTANPNHPPAPGNVYNDIGFFLGPDGNWNVSVDVHGFREMKQDPKTGQWGVVQGGFHQDMNEDKFVKSITMEVANMKNEFIASRKKLKIVSRQSSPSEKSITVEVPVERFKKMVGA